MTGLDPVMGVDEELPFTLSVALSGGRDGEGEAFDLLGWDGKHGPLKLMLEEQLLLGLDAPKLTI